MNHRSFSPVASPVFRVFFSAARKKPFARLCSSCARRIPRAIPQDTHLEIYLQPYAPRERGKKKPFFKRELEGCTTAYLLLLCKTMLLHCRRYSSCYTFFLSSLPFRLLSSFLPMQIPQGRRPLHQRAAAHNLSGFICRESLHEEVQLNPKRGGRGIKIGFPRHPIVQQIPGDYKIGDIFSRLLLPALNRLEEKKEKTDDTQKATKVFPACSEQPVGLSAWSCQSVSRRPKRS